MTYLAAAEAVLKGARAPLTVQEITELALKRGLIRPAGRTPVATMSATLYGAVNTHPNGSIQRKYTPGPARARRGSVRWAWSAK